MEKLEDKIKVGADVVIFCLAEKPKGKIISISEKTVSIEFDKGVMVVEKDDIINTPEVLQVLNYVEIKDIKFNRPVTSRDKFEETMIKTSEKFSSKREEADIYGMFMDYIVNTIDDSGSFYPIPCMFDIVKDGKAGIAMAGLALEQHQSYSAVASLILKEHPTDLMFGIIKESHANSGIDPKFKFTLCVFKLHQKLSLGSIEPAWSYGVVGFNDKNDFNQNDIVWDNQFWIERMEALLASAFIIKSKTKIGTAYKDRIEIKKWIETHNGYLYEGLVLVDKLDKKTKTFLEENKLDPNNRKQVIEFFKSKDMELDFMPSTNGLVNLMVSNQGYLFMDRRSKTRAMLEAIETIANKPKPRKSKAKKES